MLRISAICKLTQIKINDLCKQKTDDNGLYSLCFGGCFGRCSQRRSKLE